MEYDAVEVAHYLHVAAFVSLLGEEAAEVVKRQINPSKWRSF